MTLGRTISQFIWTVMGLVCIGATPALFHGIHLDVPGFVQQVLKLIQEAFQPQKIFYTNPTSGVKRSLFPDLFTPYFYSLTLIFGAYFASVVISIALSTLLIFLKKKVILRLKWMLFIMESVPDLFVIIIIQFFLVWFYQKTGVHLIKFVQFGDEKIYTLPILVMSILPTIYMTKIMLVNLENELNEPYIDLANTKGLSKAHILFVHVLRNTLVSAFFHSKSIIWMLLSNLFMVEYFYNINGITYFILNYYKPIILFMGLLLMFIPIFFFQSGLQLFIEKYTGQRREDGDK